MVRLCSWCKDDISDESMIWELPNGEVICNECKEQATD